MKKIGVLILSIILFASFVFAAPVVYPHGFNGNIISNHGNSNGKILVGYVGGVATGQAIIKNGKFDLVVTDNLGNKGKVEFYIGNEKAKETFDFETFEITETDLTFEKIPEGQTPCGNNICESGECSFCAIDCDFNFCSNGRCDAEVGETCSNSPVDCGSCPSCGDGTCNNGETCSTCSFDCGSCPSEGGSSGGGGGGGGGGGSLSKKVLLSNNGSNEEEVILPLTNQELNEENEKKEERNNSNFFSLTGQAVSDIFSSGNGIYVIIGGITILVLGIAIFSSRKKKPAVEIRTENTESPKKEDENSESRGKKKA